MSMGQKLPGNAASPLEGAGKYSAEQRERILDALQETRRRYLDPLLWLGYRLNT